MMVSDMVELNVGSCRNIEDRALTLVYEGMSGSEKYSSNE
jgi:hypothetical protein